MDEPIIKEVESFFQILWPSHNLWTLICFWNFLTFTTLVKFMMNGLSIKAAHTYVEDKQKMVSASG
jgi:hypothetical protein